MCKISKIKLNLGLCYNDEADREYIQKAYKEDEDISGKKKSLITVFYGIFSICYEF